MPERDEVVEPPSCAAACTARSAPAINPVVTRATRMGVERDGSAVFMATSSSAREGLGVGVKIAVPDPRERLAPGVPADGEHLLVHRVNDVDRVVAAGAGASRHHGVVAAGPLRA